MLSRERTVLRASITTSTFSGSHLLAVALTSTQTAPLQVSAKLSYFACESEHNLGDAHCLQILRFTNQVSCHGTARIGTSAQPRKGKSRPQPSYFTEEHNRSHRREKSNYDTSKRNALTEECPYSGSGPDSPDGQIDQKSIAWMRWNPTRRLQAAPL